MHLDLKPGSRLRSACRCVTAGTTSSSSLDPLYPTAHATPVPLACHGGQIRGLRLANDRLKLTVRSQAIAHCMQTGHSTHAALPDPRVQDLPAQRSCHTWPRILCHETKMGKHAFMTTKASKAAETPGQHALQEGCCHAASDHQSRCSQPPASGGLLVRVPPSQQSLSLISAL